MKIEQWISCLMIGCFLVFTSSGAFAEQTQGRQSQSRQAQGAETQKKLEAFARDTIMGRVLNASALFASGVKQLRKQALSGPQWEKVDTGLEYLVLGEEENPFVFARINPAQYAFTLCMSSEAGERLPLKEWAALRGLHAAINASMYLPDGQTSTGYMQSASHSNNEHIGTRLGAFFVAEPFDPDLDPPVAIVEKSDPGWEKRIARYAIRVQNFRLLTKGGVVAWRGDKEGERGSIGAIGQEKDGSIVFMVSVHPLTVAEFCDIAQVVAPQLERAMYVEGSVKVGMLLKAGGQHTIWLGRKNVVFTPAPKDTAIPNVIGIVPRR